MCQQRACRAGYAHADVLYVTGRPCVGRLREVVHAFDRKHQKLQVGLSIGCSISDVMSDGWHCWLLSLVWLFGVTGSLL